MGCTPPGSSFCIRETRRANLASFLWCSEDHSTGTLFVPKHLCSIVVLSVSDPTNSPEHSMASECLGLPCPASFRRITRTEDWRASTLKPQPLSFSQHGLLDKSHSSHAVEALVCVPFVFRQRKPADSAGVCGAGTGDFLPKCAMCLEHIH